MSEEVVPNYQPKTVVHIVWLPEDAWPVICWNGHEWPAASLTSVVTWPGPEDKLLYIKFMQHQPTSGSVSMVSFRMGSDAELSKLIGMVSSVVEEVPYDNRVERAITILTSAAFNQPSLPFHMPEGGRPDGHAE